MKTESMPTAAKKSPRSNYLFVTFLYHIVTCLTGNANFATPSPSAATLKAAADGLSEANAKAKHGGPADTADRDAKRKAAEALVDQYVAYAQATVKAQAGDPATAKAMILGGGLSVREHNQAPKPPLAPKYGAVSGQVLLVALAVAATATYFWEVSSDGKVWQTLPYTMKAKTTVSGLTAGQVYYFRFRAQTRKGMGDYSQVVSLLVH